MDISQDLTTGIITFSNKFDLTTITTIPLVLPSQDGGFESSPISGTAGFEANGWTVINDATSQWFVGVTGATGQSQFGAYISSNGGSSATYGKTSSTSWFYRDIELPPFAKKIDISFDLKVGGDSYYDKVRVFNLSEGYQLAPGQFLPGHLEEFSNVDWKKLNLSSNVNFSTATQSRRIAFGWSNNNGVQHGDSAKIDNINISVDCLYQTLNSPPIFSTPGQEWVLSFSEQKFVKNLKSFNYDTLGINEERYLFPYYRISRDGISWTEWLTVTKNFNDFPKIDPLDPFYFEIKWVRKGTSTVGIIRIIDYKIEGQLERDIQEEPGESTLVQKGKSIVIKAPFIYKVFKIFDTEIISSTGIPESCKISYRYSQDNSKTWSKWEPFDKQHITTIRINPIRFFQIEYLIENNSQIPVSIQDINLIGDFQNVTEDYKKTNLFGIRQCCQSNVMGTYDQNGVFVPNTTLNQNGGQGGPGCDPNISSLPQMTTDEKAGLYNPYQQSQAMNLLQKLSNDSQMIFGHRVIYFATDPDKKGTDHIINEYQLYNVVCEGELKVSVDSNQFPDSQIVMNQFDLNLFETFQVHVTKQQFKELFGPQRRPAKEDFLYFCDLNRMYSVDHAQQFRNFNNAAVYYKLVLKKFNKTSNIDYADNDIKITVDKLTKNTTINELFSSEIAEQKDAIANKNQNQPLTHEPIRLEYLAEISKELIENSSTIISKSHYDLSSVTFGDVAVRYRNFKTIFKSTNNFGYYCWFNLNNYLKDEIYNLFHFFDRLNTKGWKVHLENDKILLQMGGEVYTWNLDVSTGDTTALVEDTWYCYVLNIDQRSSQVSQWIYKRNVDDEQDAPTLFYTTLRKVYEKSQSITPISFEVGPFAPEILASDMKMTNIRLFNDIIPESTHNKILNQYIIGDDSKHLIFADNATTRIYLPKFPLFE